MIRDMTQADVDAVLAIEQSVQAFPWSRQQFVASLQQGYAAYVYQQDTQVMAYLMALIGVDEVEILTLAVASVAQRRGLAQQLLQHVRQQALQQGKMQLLLEVSVVNEAACALYRRLGFEQIGLRRAYYVYQGKKQDALVMRCMLS